MKKGKLAEPTDGFPLLPRTTVPLWWEWAACWCGGRSHVPGMNCGGPFTDEFGHEFDYQQGPCCGPRGWNCDYSEWPMENWWVTYRDVKIAMGSMPLTQMDEEWLELSVRAANALIRRLRPDLCKPQRGGAFTGQFTDQYDNADRNLPADVRYGAVQLALETYRRRGLTSGEGVPGYGEFGGSSLSSLSYEAQLFLQLGRHARPVLG